MEKKAKITTKCFVISKQIVTFAPKKSTHGIIKKTQKTPKKEIAKAERIRQEYFNAKQ